MAWAASRGVGRRQRTGCICRYVFGCGRWWDGENCLEMILRANLWCRFRCNLSWKRPGRIRDQPEPGRNGRNTIFVLGLVVGVEPFLSRPGPMPPCWGGASGGGPGQSLVCREPWLSLSSGFVPGDRSIPGLVYTRDPRDPRMVPGRKSGSWFSARENEPYIRPESLFT